MSSADMFGAAALIRHFSQRIERFRNADRDRERGENSSKKGLFKSQRNLAEGGAARGGRMIVSALKDERSEGGR